MCDGSKYGLATLLVSDQFCTLGSSWKFEERYTVILFGTTLVMAAYAPDSGKSTDMYEAFISTVLKVLREGRRGWSQRLLHYRRSYCVVGNDVYKRKGHRGAQCDV